MTTNPDKRLRLSLDLEPEDRQLVDLIAQKRNRSLTNTVMAGIRLQHFFLRHEDSEGRVRVINTKGEIETLVFLF